MATVDFDDAKPRMRCEQPGCDKSFLRREHLVRHQLNRQVPRSECSVGYMQC